MKHVLLLFSAFGSFFLISEVHGQQPSNSIEEWKRDLQQADSDFKCPFIFGSFADPDDCDYFYICIAGKGFRKKCGLFQSFDILRRRCLPSIVAICGSNKDKSTTSTSTVTVSTATATTPDGGNFVCSSFIGSFPHPTDCSKYYSCFMYRHTLKTCSKKELFDAVKKSCQPEAQVHCGTRERPPDLRTTEIPDETTTGIITTSIKEETPKEPTATDTVTETLPTTLETTEVIITTTEAKPTGPPEHDCDEDDLDCIITETGDDWFKCPADVGSYPHPSSEKLFIFCMNWIPSVKKCGLDLKFSKELATCIKNFL